jgi:hypothetical protein
MLLYKWAYRIKVYGGMEVTLHTLMPTTSVGDYSVSFCWQKGLDETPSLSSADNRTLWSTGGITAGCRKPGEILP